MQRLFSYVVLAGLALVNCGRVQPDERFYKPAAADDAPIPRSEAFVVAPWEDLNLAELTNAEVRDAVGRSCEQSIAWLEGVHAPETVTYGDREFTREQTVASHRRFLALLRDFSDTESFRGQLAASFTLLRSVGHDNGKTLFTGYYVESLDGSLTPQNGYTPIYGVPTDLVQVKVADFAESREGDILRGTLRWLPQQGFWVLEPLGEEIELQKGQPTPQVTTLNVTRFAEGAKTIRGRAEGGEVIPYWTRGEIADGALLGRGLEIAWAKSDIDLFFTEIQGTGILHLPSGDKVTVHYSSQNGHKYLPIGRLLRDEGHLPPDGVTMQSIYAWLIANPADRQRVFNYNPSFVFFELIDGGAQGYPNLTLTSRHSFAADLEYFPKAGLAFIDLPKPAVNEDGAVGEDGRIARFGFLQDTGGAIKGPGRIDIFWGDDAEAKATAGITQHEGNVYVIAP